MTCSTTSNTYKKDYIVIKGSTLVITGSMTAGGVAMNLTGYTFPIEFSESPDFATPSITGMDAVIASNTYTFTITLPSTKGTHYYRVKEIDSLSHLNPEALRSGKITITD